MSKSNEDVLTATNSQGDTSFMVCNRTEEGKKVCMDVENAGNNTSRSNAATPAGGTMLDNNTYDLMEQLLIENKSLWRIKNNYKSDSAMDSETKDVWNFIEKDKEELVKILTAKVKERL